MSSVASRRLRVAIRLRPTRRQATHGGAIELEGQDPSALRVDLASPCGRRLRRRMRFDVCLGRDATQEDVMNSGGIYQLLDAAATGLCVCIMAYGPTGTGKTYTMSGKDADEGVIQKAARYLLAQRGEDPAPLRLSYIEVYDEAVYDLLGPRQGKLPVKGSAEIGFYAAYATTVTCGDVDTLQTVLEEGMARRRIGSHALNNCSSRSHTLFTIELGNGCGGRVLLVDLAGSERLKDAKQNRHETATINQSLFCLGKVISALSEGRTGAHVPYRDAVLTKLLKGALTGEGLTLLITCCAPSNVEETLTTLNYAQKAMGIGHAVEQIEVPKPRTELTTLREEVLQLRRQNAALRRRLSAEADGQKDSWIESAFPATKLLAEEDWTNNGLEMMTHQQDWSSGAGAQTLLAEMNSLKAKLTRLELQLLPTQSCADDPVVFRKQSYRSSYDTSDVLCPPYAFPSRCRSAAANCTTLPDRSTAISEAYRRRDLPLCGVSYAMPEPRLCDSETRRGGYIVVHSRQM